MDHKIKKNLYESVADIIRCEIIDGSLKAGTHICESDIAQRLGISRGPIREALKTLEIEGLVQTLSNGRTISSGFTTEDVYNYYHLRFFIESEALRQIMSQEPSEEYWNWIAEIESLLNESKKYVMDNFDGQFTKLDYQFHLSILEFAKVKIYIHIWKIMFNISQTIMEVNRKFLANEKIQDLNLTYTFHDKILIGLKERDADYAILNLKQHTENGIKTYEKIIKCVSENK